MKSTQRAFSKAIPLLLTVPLLIYSCDSDSEKINVTGVSIDPPTLLLEIGQSRTLTASVTPSDADNRSVTWSSDEPAVAKVDPSTGEVTALSEGEASIIVTTRDGGKTDRCTVTVVENVIEVSSVSLNKSELSLEIGEHEILEAAVYPENATDRTLTWSSSNPSVATVHPETGHVTGFGEGECVVTVTAVDGTTSDRCTVTVTDTYDPAGPAYDNVAGLVANCADPYILETDGTYYLYGTGGSDGIRVHTSTDLVNWTINQGATNGYALHKNNVWGTANFWAPEVYFIEGKYHMFYSANERLSVAASDSPLGPFSTPPQDQRAFHADIGEIDSHVFIDDDGRKYIYFVRFNDGNCIWVAELNDDLNSVDESTLRQCISATHPWEVVQDRVAEGPFVLKQGDYYYLTYSANHYESKQYAVGYAYSTSPVGPWTKSYDNPILIGDGVNITGTGHHSFFNSPSGALYIVYHAHYSPSRVQSRKTCIDRAFFDYSTTPARIVVNGPTTTPQQVR